MDVKIKFHHSGLCDTCILLVGVTSHPFMHWSENNLPHFVFTESWTRHYIAWYTPESNECDCYFHSSAIVKRLMPGLVLYETVNVWLCMVSQMQHQNLLKIRNKLILCISTELCHQNSTIGSQNGPFNPLHILRSSLACK